MCCDQRVVAVVLVEAVPSRVRVEARSTWSRGQRRAEGPATVSYSSHRLCNDWQAASGTRGRGWLDSLGLVWSQGSHRGSMNTLGSSVTKNGRVVEWEQRERVMFAGGRVCTATD